MAISDFVEKINSLNNVNDVFWQKYLERIKENSKVTWYHSSGFDLRPFYVISELTSFGDTYYCTDSYDPRFTHEYNIKDGRLKIRKVDLTFESVGKELQKSEFVFSDSYDFYYDSLLSIWIKKQQGILQDNDFSKLSIDLSVKSLLSIEPFRLLTERERKSLNSMKFKHSADITHGVNITVDEKREYDGFFLKIAKDSSSHITMIFLCLDDRIVKKIFDDFYINVICIFENTAGGGEGGGLSFHCLYDTPESTKTIKYIFTENYHFDIENNKLILDYDSIAKDYIVKNYSFGCNESTLFITDTIDSVLGIRIKKRYDQNNNKFILSIDNDNGNQLLNYLFGRIHGELKITNGIKNGQYGREFCLAIKSISEEKEK